jgi:hypothetical protein
MRRVIGIDIHRTFGEVVIWEEGRIRHAGRVDMTRTALEGFGKGLRSDDEVVIEATGNCMAVSRVLSPFVARVVIANPLQVKAIAHAHVKTDKIDAGTLASLHAAGYLPEIWTPDAATERMRRLAARRFQIVRHRTRIKNEVHSILHAHLIPRCPHADLFSGVGRAWLLRQPVPADERGAIERHIRELDRLTGDLAGIDKEIAGDALDDDAIARRAKRGHQVAAVALARKLTVLCWHLLTKQTDYRWARPALVANKRRTMELKAGKPQKKGNKPGPAYAYNVKALRDQEMEVARHAEQSYEHFVAQWEKRPKVRGRSRPAGL